MTRRLDLVGLGLLLAAVLLALWWGVGAPDVSPVFTEAPGLGGDGPGSGLGPGEGR